MRVVVVGAGGFGRETLDVVEAAGRAGTTDLVVTGVVDDHPSEVTLERLAVRGVPYLGTVDEWLAGATPEDGTLHLLGVGNPVVRRKLDERLTAAGRRAATAVHPAAAVRATRSNVLRARGLSRRDCSHRAGCRDSPWASAAWWEQRPASCVTFPLASPAGPRSRPVTSRRAAAGPPGGGRRPGGVTPDSEQLLREARADVGARPRAGRDALTVGDAVIAATGEYGSIDLRVVGFAVLGAVAFYAQPVSTLARELIGLRTGRTARRGSAETRR